MIHWDWLPDLNGLSPAEIRDQLAGHSDYAGSRAGNLTKHANEIHLFVNEVDEGDLVVMPLGPPSDGVAIGRVLGPYEYRQSTLNPLRHVLPAEWLAHDLPRSRLSDQAQAELSARSTVRGLSPETSAELDSLVSAKQSRS